MVLEAFNEPLVKREIVIPALERGQVLVKLSASGVCGSDVHQWKGEDPRIPLPLIPGHEGVGTVVETVGEKLTVDGKPLEAGDSIIWNRGVVCRACRFCTVLGEPSLCPNRRVYGISIPADEPPYLNGCYADYIILREGTDVFHADTGIDPAVLVPASCSGATVAHAFDMLDGTLAGATVVVQGPGPLGLFAAAFAREYGASEVVMIGGTPGRLALAEEFGAGVVLNRRETTVEERREAVLSLTSGRGADIVIEATGAHGAAIEGIRLLRRGGTFLTTGYSQPVGTEEVDFYRDIVLKNAIVRGVWVSDTRHLAMAVALVSKHPALFGKLVTHRLPLERAGEALGIVDRREALKAVLTFGTVVP